MAAKLCLGSICVSAETSKPLLPGCIWGDAAEHAAALACLSGLLPGGAARLLRNMVLDLYALCASRADAVMLAQRGPVAVVAPRSCSLESLEEDDSGWRAALRCGSGETVIRCTVEKGEGSAQWASTQPRSKG